MEIPAAKVKDNYTFYVDFPSAFAKSISIY